MGVVYFFLLSCLGLAITVQAQNCSRPVPGPNMNVKGNDILLETFPDGAKVTFACDVGYTPAGGSSAITCTAGKWSPVRLRCERKNCGSVGEVSNGHVDYSEGTEFGDKAVITCETGYMLVGKSEIICGDQGWMGRLPSCEVVTCDPPPMIVNGAFSPNDDQYSYRDVVLYSCKTDYTLNGSKSRTCSEDGTFKPDPPTCVMVQCGDPVVVNADWVEGSRPPYRFSSTVKFQCRSGYNMKGQQAQTCDLNGKWSPGLPTCEPKNCSRPVPGPNMSLKGNNTLLQTFSHRTTVSFACDVGYTSAGGSEVITCTTGSWSPVMLRCERNNCGSAGEVTNGRIDYREGTKFRDKAVITCDTGYTLVGKSEITCGDKGWSDRLPVCEVVTCDPPPMIVNGAFSPNDDQYSYRDVVLYSCKTGYTLNGSKSRTCSEDGTFKPDPPTCVMVQCGDPVVVNADWVEGSRPPYRHLSTVKFQCRSGYNMKGQQTQTCDINGKWSPGLPTCELVQCEDPVVDNAEWVEGSRPPYRFSSTVTFQCRSGYNLKGESTQTCNVDGKWSPGLPTCEFITPDWSLIQGITGGFIVGFIAGVGVTLVVQSLMKKRQCFWRNSPDRNDRKEDGELVALS